MSFSASWAGHHPLTWRHHCKWCLGRIGLHHICDECNRQGASAAPGFAVGGEAEVVKVMVPEGVLWVNAGWEHGIGVRS